MRRVGMHAIQKDHLIYYQIGLSENYQETSTNCVDKKLRCAWGATTLYIRCKMAYSKAPIECNLTSISLVQIAIFSDYFLSFVRSF